VVAYIISRFVVLFPAFDVASAYPLNAITLGKLSHEMSAKSARYEDFFLYPTVLFGISMILTFLWHFLVQETT
jgi:hypothetical protein